MQIFTGDRGGGGEKEVDYNKSIVYNIGIAIMDSYGYQDVWDPDGAPGTGRR